MSDSFVTPWTVAHQAPLSMGFPRQEYWSRLLLPSSEDLPDPGTEITSPALAGRFFTAESPGKPQSGNEEEETAFSLFPDSISFISYSYSEKCI